MALNPFFLQGTASEQRLVQDLINEHLQFHGVEVTYIPRKFVNRKTIIEEVQTSKFDDNFSIEAYVNNYDGYSGAGDILTKFGVSVRDELMLTISKERFEDFIAPFMAGQDDGTDSSELPTSNRPREGDLVYFPLGQRLFEIKFVEHEDPFYQLGKNYVFMLKCELFEYEDEVIDTSINVIDTQVQDEGYITTLNMIGVGRTATASAIIQGTLGSGYIRKIFLNNDGSGYTSTPTIGITSSPTGQVGDNATAVGVLTTKGGVTSLEKILLTNAGAGYTVAPTVTITGGGGVGAAATAQLVTSGQGVIRFVMTDSGVGYGTAPKVTVPFPVNLNASATALTNNVGVVTALNLNSGGQHYTSAPQISFTPEPQGLYGILTDIRVQSVYDGSGYTVGDIISLETPPSSIAAGYGGTGAQIRVDAVNNVNGLITSGLTIINGGYGYDATGNTVYRVTGGTGSSARLTPQSVTTSPAVSAAATATVTSGSITSLTLNHGGSGYLTTPTVVISDDIQYRDTSEVGPTVGIASIGLDGTTNVVKSILIEDAGRGYSQAPVVTIADPESLTGIGTFQFNEIVTGSRSFLRARVKEWDADTLVLKVSNVGTSKTAPDGKFFPGETIIGETSGARYVTNNYVQDDTYDKYTENDEFETLGDNLLDFTESNPFGTF